MTKPTDNYPLLGLVQRILNNDLLGVDQALLMHLVYAGNRVQRALTVEKYIELGCARHEGPGGAYERAGSDCGCSSRSCRRAHKELIENLRGARSALGPEWTGQVHPVYNDRSLAPVPAATPAAGAARSKK